MRFAVSLFVFILLASSAHARPVADVAMTGTVGCSSKNDLLDLMRAGHVGSSDEGAFKSANDVVRTVMAQKIRENRVFSISQRQMAYTARNGSMGLTYGSA